MKYAAASLLSIGLLTLTIATACAQQMRAGQVTVYVANPLDSQWPGEVVAVAWRSLREQLPAVRADRVRVMDAGTGTELLAQSVDNDGDGAIDELLFQAGFLPMQERAFLIEAVAPRQSAALIQAAGPNQVAGSDQAAAQQQAAAAQPAAGPKAHVRHHAERDDIAWENDRVAFRTYGAGLSALEPLVSSGIDVWTKRTRDLIVDKWYADGHYHTDSGEGADFFSVGPTLGAGGTAVWRDGQLHRAPNFASHRILADGPLRAVVELSYGPFEAGDASVEETKRITIDAGEFAFRSESSFRGGEPSLQYVTGLVEREGFVASTNTKAGWTWLSGWGPVARATGGHGDLGTAVLIPETNAADQIQADGHHFVVAEARSGEPAVHYVASGWTASGDFDDVEDWWTYLDDFAERLANPLQVSFGARDPMRTAADQALQKAHEDLKPFLDDPDDPDAIPRSLNDDGTFHGTSSDSWTSGFYPGVLWYLYEATGDELAADAARRWTAVVEPEKTNAGTHDMGFKIYSSFGNGYRLTRDPHYRDVIVESANTLMTRFHPTVGAIRSWDWGDWRYNVIIDNMMNLELLFAATRLTGDSSYYDVGVQHALTTLQNHFRDDYSSVHVVEFDTLTGEVIARKTHQGLGDESAWSRGQAWGLYGFTMTYRETGDVRFLTQARRIADFILSHPNQPDDFVPYWDYDAPGIPDEPRDASAAAVTSSALYELSRYVAGDERIAYVHAADRMLTSLASETYQADAGIPGPFLLAHSTGSVPGEFEVDSPLIYADYYYLEALLRRLQLPTTR